MDKKVVTLGQNILNSIDANYPQQEPSEVLVKFRLGEENIRDLLIYLLKEGHYHFYSYLLGLWAKIQGLNYQDFQDILVEFSTYKRNSIMRYLENYLESVYMFIGIDLFGEYQNLRLENRIDQQLTLQYYYERPGVLCLRENEYELKKLGLSLDIFKHLQEKLILQGAKKAVQIAPENHRNGVLFTVQGEPPVDWLWARKVAENWIEE